MARRVKGSGRLARIITVPIALVIIISVFMNMLGTNAQPLTGINGILAVVFLVISTAALIRSAFLGVWLFDSGIRYVSWYHQGFIQWSELYRVEVEPYSGFFNKGSSSRMLGQIVLVTMSLRTKELSGMIGFRKLANRQAEEVRQWAVANGWLPPEPEGKHIER